MTVKFYLGTHMPSWLAKVDIPLFVSHRRLSSRRTLPRAVGPWALDSGAICWPCTTDLWAADPRRHFTPTELVERPVQ